MPVTNHRALIVGINNYPGLGPLLGAEWDAARFKDWLVNPQGGNLAPTAIKNIFSDPKAKTAAQAKPLESQINKFVQKMQDEAAQIGGDFPLGDRLYLFFSGHGFHNPESQSGFFMANATPQATGFGIPAKELWDYICLEAWFREVVLVCDACRTFLPYGKPLSCPFTPSNSGSGVRGIAILATNSGSDALELPTGPGGQVQGVLTTAVLHGLDGFAVRRSRAKNIDADDLGDYVRNSVIDQLGLDFGPEVAIRGSFLVVPQVEQRKCILNISTKAGAPPSKIKLLDDRDTVVADYDMTIGPFVGTFAAGIYYLVVTGREDVPVNVFQENCSMEIP